MTRSPSEGTPAASVEGTTPPSLRELAERAVEAQSSVKAIERRAAEDEFAQWANPAAILALYAEIDAKDAWHESELAGCRMERLASDAVIAELRSALREALTGLDEIAHVPSYDIDQAEAFYDAIRRVDKLRDQLRAAAGSTT